MRMGKNTRRRRNFQSDKHVNIQLENKGKTPIKGGNENGEFMNGSSQGSDPWNKSALEVAMMVNGTGGNTSAL